LATNKKPEGTKVVPVHLPLDLHRQLTTLAGRGKVSDLIVECLREPISKRYQKWLKDELQRSYDLANENRQGTIRRGAAASGEHSAEKDVRNKSREERKREGP
jgi:hypothetical protein